ncbi:AvrE-family type 3 secretion system effector [Erwinia amylovora]
MEILPGRSATTTIRPESEKPPRPLAGFRAGPPATAQQQAISRLSGTGEAETPPVALHQLSGSEATGLPARQKRRPLSALKQFFGLKKKNTKSTASSSQASLPVAGSPVRREENTRQAERNVPSQALRTGRGPTLQSLMAAESFEEQFDKLPSLQELIVSERQQDQQRDNFARVRKATLNTLFSQSPAAEAPVRSSSGTPTASSPAAETALATKQPESPRAAPSPAESLSGSLSVHSEPHSEESDGVSGGRTLPSPARPMPVTVAEANPVQGAEGHRAGGLARTASRFPVAEVERAAPLIFSLVKGKIQVGEGTPAALKALCEHTLGRPGQHYIAHLALEDNAHHLLLDRTGILFSVRSQADGGLLAMHTSVPLLPARSGKRQLPVALLKEENSPEVCVRRGMGAEASSLAVRLPDTVHRAQITGVRHRASDDDTAEDQTYRLHDGKLYQRDPTLQVWQQASAITHSQLSQQSDGRIYALRDHHTLCDLTDGRSSERFVSKIKSYSAAENGQVALLTDTPRRQEVCILPTLDAEPEARITAHLRLATPDWSTGEGRHTVEAEAIGLSGQTLYVADTEGRLLTGELPSPGQDVISLTARVQHELPAGAWITGFAHDDEGRLNALVADNFRHTHLFPLGEHHQFQSGWNLSDSLVLDHRQGLDQINPEEHAILSPGLQGRLTLQQGKIYFFDRLTQAWSNAGVDADRLVMGLDARAYILHEGQVKPLSLNQSTSSLKQGRENVFSLPHVRNKPEAGNALPGSEKANKITDFAPLTPYHYLTLNEKGEVHVNEISPGTRQLTQPPFSPGREGIEGDITHIQLDGQKNLYAQTQSGALYLLPCAQWQSGQQGRWQPVSPPSTSVKLSQLMQNSKGEPVALLENGTRYARKDALWHRMPEQEAASTDSAEHEMDRPADALYQRLASAKRGFRIPGTGVTAAASAQLLGHNGAENQQVRSSLSARLRSHVFNPTMTLPRPLKNAGYAQQHRWQGREGLRGIYEMQSALFRQLEAQNGRKGEPRPDLATRLTQLDLGEQGEPLKQELIRFARIIEGNACRALIFLGQEKGVTDRTGQLKAGYRPDKTKGLIQSMNVNRSGSDVCSALLKAVHHIKPSEESALTTLLEKYVAAGVDIHHQKAEIPLGRQRDPNDKVNLIKSRLLLDVLTLGELHTLLDSAGMVSGERPGAGPLDKLKTALTELRDHRYRDNPVRLYSDMGMISTRALEANYDAVKAFLNAFKKDHHGLNVTTRAVLQAEDSQALEHRLRETVMSLRDGESLSLNRAYGGGVSTAFVPRLPVSIPVPVVPGVGVTYGRSYGLSFSRSGDEFSVSFGRDGDLTGSASVATGYDVLPHLLNREEGIKDLFSLLGEKLAFMPDLRMGGGASASIKAAQSDALSFTLGGAEMADFIGHLVRGELQPASLMQSGAEHKTKEGNKVVFNLDGNGAFEVRAAIGTQNSSPDNMTGRVAAGINASANVLSSTREREVTRGVQSRAVRHSDNRVRFLTQLNVGVGLTASAGVAHSVKQTGTFPAFTSSGLSGALSAEDRTNQRIKFELKKAEPAEQQEVDEVIGRLGKHFTDVSSQQVIEGVKSLDSVEEQLTILHRHFSVQPRGNDDRYEDMQSLSALKLRHESASQDKVTLNAVRHETSYSNLSRLDRESVFNLIRRHLDSSLPPDRARQLRLLMANNPLLDALIGLLQKTPHASAVVTMELKDSVKDQMEASLFAGKLTSESEIKNLFSQRANLRIRSVAFSQSVNKSEGFTTPTLLVGGSSSAGVSMERNLGTINFKYGQDQMTPRRFTLEGDIARANPAVAGALYTLKKEGIELR